MKLNHRTKERLLTGGAVLLICAVGVVLPGCSTQQSKSITLHTKEGTPITITQVGEQCTTDFDCEMHAHHKTSHRKYEAWTWKRIAGVVGGLVVAGLIYDQLDSRGRNQQSDSQSVDVTTPRVNCSGSCAQ